MRWHPRLSNCWAAFKERADSTLLGSAVNLRRANAIVCSKLNGTMPDNFRDDTRLGHSQETLDAALVSTIDRLERVEDKAKSTLLGIGVAMAVLAGANGIAGPNGALHDYGLTARIMAGLLLTSAMTYLIGSGYLALQAYGIGQVYRPSLENQAPLVDKATHAMFTLYCIEQNWRVTTLRANQLSACFSWLRNGLVAVALLGMLVIVAAVAAGPAKKEQGAVGRVDRISRHLCGARAPRDRTWRVRV